jgi:hypothetical protein
MVLPNIFAVMLVSLQKRSFDGCRLPGAALAWRLAALNYLWEGNTHDWKLSNDSAQRRAGRAPAGRRIAALGGKKARHIR